MSLLLFLKPHYNNDGGRKAPIYQPVVIEEPEARPARKKKKKKEFVIEKQNRASVAIEAIESLFEETNKKRLKKRNERLKLLLKLMFDD